MPKTEFPESATTMTSEDLYNILREHIEFPDGVFHFTLHATMGSYVTMDLSYYPSVLDGEPKEKLSYHKYGDIYSRSGKYKLVEIEDTRE